MDFNQCCIDRSAGGLVTAVAPVVISGNGVWVGWPGMHMENPDEAIPESDPNDRTPTAGLLSRKVSLTCVHCGFFFVFSIYCFNDMCSARLMTQHGISSMCYRARLNSLYTCNYNDPEV